MIGSGYELLVISSIGGSNLNELRAPIHNSRPDPIPILIDSQLAGLYIDDGRNASLHRDGA